jgi:hypothetical protein
VHSTTRSEWRLEAESWVLEFWVLEFWVLEFWVLGFWVLGFWVLGSGAEVHDRRIMAGW